MIVSQWLDAANTEKNVGWARDFWKALQPFAGGGAYVNDLSQDDEDRMSIGLRRQLRAVGSIEEEVRPRQFLPPEPEHQACRLIGY